MKPLHRTLLIAAIALALLLAGIVLARELAGLPAPQLTGAAEGAGTPQIGAGGPITLHFADSMDTGSVEARLRITAGTAGEAVEAAAQWQGNAAQTLFLRPARPLTPGQVYTVRLEAGAVSQSGRPIRAAGEWQVEVRQPEILYLSPSEAPELWRVPAGTSSPVQMTSTRGKLFDYDVSADGLWIVYSAENDEGGIDLWEVRRSGGQPRHLLPCRADWCINPAYAPDGSRLVYSRRQAQGGEGGSPGAPRLWALDRSSLETDRLYVDPNVGGFDPAWSPDGRYLTFFDGLSQGMRVYDAVERTDFLIESEMGMTGAWSPDGRRLLYNRYEITGEQPAVNVYELDVLTRQSRQVLGDADQPFDYSIPEFSPDSTLLVVAMRPFSGNPGKQLWLMPLDGSGQTGQPRQITQDPVYNNAAARWSPAGQALVFQRLKLGSSSSRPEVAAWDAETGEITFIAEDAFQPGWLP